MGHGKVEELLRTRIGLDPGAAGPGLIPRAVRARMGALGMPEDDVQRYDRLLSSSSSEFQALVEEVVIPESWFFRDEVPFTLLRDHGSRLLTTEPFRPPLRVLSMPCAGGEEPYSVAIALLDAGIAPERFRIDAVDVSENALEVARRAVYSTNSFRSNDLSFRDRYFQPTAKGFALDPRIAGLVRFHPANVLSEELLPGEGPFDAVFCRNLLIYLDAPGRARVMGHVERLLAPRGLLFVGHAEQLGFLGNRFRQVDVRGSFAFERVELAETTAAGPRGAMLPSLPAPRPKPPRKALPPRDRPTSALGRKSQPSSSEPAAVRSGSGGPLQPSLLEQASKLADAGQNDEAARLCDEDIRRRGPTASAYFLLGMIGQATDDRTRAESYFEKAVYLDVRHEDALLALALLAQRRGDLAASANYKRRAERAYQENQRR
jgi:chemotaxis protein methyltransferase WspC